MLRFIHNISTSILYSGTFQMLISSLASFLNPCFYSNILLIYLLYVDSNLKINELWLTSRIHVIDILTKPKTRYTALAIINFLLNQNKVQGKGHNVT